MQTHLKKQHIPWGMAGARVALGPMLIAGASCGWSGLALAAMVFTALLSDIYDGVLARRWHCDTPAVRLFDSMADTFFYLCTGYSLWIVQPQLWRTYAVPLIALLALEALRFAFDLRKFGKPASYHSWLAKAWGLTLAIAIVAVFAKGWSYPLVSLALWMGIACDLEGLAMSLMLPTWRKDVRTLRAAWQLRLELQGEVTMNRASQIRNKQPLLRGAILFILTWTLTSPLLAVEAGQVVYVSGISPLIAKGTIGTLDTTYPTALIFHTAGNASAATLSIDYKEMKSVQYSTEVARHLGVVPAIAAGLVRRRERQHFFTITYGNSPDALQAVVFEVPKHDPRGLIAILRARAPQACTRLSAYTGESFP